MVEDFFKGGFLSEEVYALWTIVIKPRLASLIYELFPQWGQLVFAQCRSS